MPNEATDLEVIEKMGDVMETKPATSNLYTCENGIVLKLRSVPRSIVSEAMARWPAPKPPIIKDENTGREIHNDVDPRYLDEVEKRNNAIGKLMWFTYLGMGTSVVSIPEGMCDYNSDEWIDDINSLMEEAEVEGSRIEVKGKNTKARYVAWLRMYAMNQSDYDAVTTILYSGFIPNTKEETVASAMAGFPDNGAGRTDNGSGTATE